MPHRSPTRRLAPLPTLLGAIVLLAGALAYEAAAALREREALAARTLRDYVGFAALELAAKVGDAMSQAIGQVLDPATASPATSPYDRLTGLDVVTGRAAAGLPCEAPAGAAPPRVFQLDLRNRALETTAPESVELRRWLADTVAYAVRLTYRPDQRHMVIDHVPGDTGVVVAFSVKWSQLGAQAVPVAPIGVVGFLRCRSAFGAPLVRGVLARRPLLPGALSGRLPNDSVLAVQLSTMAGRVVWANAGDGAPELTARTALPTPAALAVEVAIRAGAVARLEVGAPRAGGRLSWLLGLLAVSAVLLIVAFGQFRREQELNRSRSDFTSSVSHELRTPLAQILLAAETLTLGRARDGEEREAAAGIIVSEGRRLLRMVENVLSFARFARSVPSPEARPVRLAPLIRDVLTQWLAAGTPARIVLDLDESAWGRLEPGAATQILHNLVDNAVKFGPPGQTIAVSAVSHGDVVELSVADEGPGVPESERERIWEPFVRAESTARRIGGTGLGLAVVRELTHQLGGSVMVEEGAMGGARFVVRFPRADAPRNAERGMAPRTLERP